MKENTSLAEFLRGKRIEAGYSRLDLAKLLGYNSAQFVSNWERGLSHPPIPALIKLSDIFNSRDLIFEITLQEKIRHLTLDLHKKFHGRKSRQKKLKPQA